MKEGNAATTQYAVETVIDEESREKAREQATATSTGTDHTR